jgi:hypothetical protein
MFPDIAIHRLLPGSTVRTEKVDRVAQRVDAMKLRSRREAAEYLTRKSGVLFTETGLCSRATASKGPRYAILNGRAVYLQEALDEWLDEQLAAARPSAKRDHEPYRPQAA